MATIKSMCIVVCLSVMAAGLLGFAPYATGETLNYKLFNHPTKIESFPLPDAAGHEVMFMVREGVNIFENGELAWVKAVNVRDVTKGVGTFDMYATITFPDGSMILIRTKGTTQATPAGVQSAAEWTGDIIYGTGRFQGIKGTQTTSSKLFPLEKGELGGKSIGQGTFNYTLPPK